MTAGESSTTTDAAGHYEMMLPVGTYDMTVTKYGYFPGSAEDVEVAEGNTTMQDFTLEAAPSEVVNGTVKRRGRQLAAVRAASRSRARGIRGRRSGPTR